MKPLISKADQQAGQLPGQLYVVATPIGNLDDFSKRAIAVLSSVSVVLAEDTRHSKRLLNHYGINTRLKSCHQHNEQQQVVWVMEQLSAGNDLALISDAGTPLISDPGFNLVSALRRENFNVVTVPGPSSIIAALSIAGLPTDRFVFDGFLPVKSAARQSQLSLYLNEVRTVVLLESSHRIVASLTDFERVLGGDRRLVIARELTKKFETVLDGSISELANRLADDSDQTRGEFVLMLAGVSAVAQEQFDTMLVLKELTAVLPLKQASTIAAKLTGKRKNELYDLALSLKSDVQD